MTINNLSQELNITNKELLTYLKEKGFNAKSHLQTATDEMATLAREHFKDKPQQQVKQEEPEEEKAVKKVSKTIPAYQVKRFDPDDLIPCKSIVPWKVVLTGADKQTVYRWGGFGDVEYVPYRDLQTWRRNAVKDGLIMIEDPDICYQWKKELGAVYDNFLNVEYPEEFFDLDDEVFEKLLNNAPNNLKEVIKFTAMDMIRNTNYPSLSKISIVDKVLNTCIKDFL